MTATADDSGALAGYSDVYHAARCLFGLGTHTTRERIRVGRALRSLPRIEEALRSGDISYSAAREVTRVATVEDESTWIQLARELPIRALERRVVEAAGRGPRGRADEGAQLRWSTPETVEVTLRLPAETWALLQRAMEGARRASEASLIEAEALSAVARDALERQNTDADTADPRHTVVLYECQSCARTEIDTGAGAVELGAEAAATLGCGARVRDLRTEGRVVRRGGPLPAAIERAVRLRDRNRCRVPGCFRRRYVDVHHLTFQSEGGEHSRSNCVCLCTTHHARLHDGRLRIEGDSEGELMFHDATGAPLSWPAASHGGTAEAAMPATSHGRTSATPPASHGGRAEAAGGRAEAAAGGTAARLVALMGRRGGWSVDSLVEASGLGVGELQGALLTLELDGHVEFDGRGGYAPARAGREGPSAGRRGGAKDPRPTRDARRPRGRPAFSPSTDGVSCGHVGCLARAREARGRMARGGPRGRGVLGGSGAVVGAGERRIRRGAGDRSGLGRGLVERGRWPRRRRGDRRRGRAGGHRGGVRAGRLRASAGAVPRDDRRAEGVGPRRGVLVRVLPHVRRAHAPRPGRAAAQGACLSAARLHRELRPLSRRVHERRGDHLLARRPGQQVMERGAGAGRAVFRGGHPARHGGGRSCDRSELRVFSHGLGAGRGVLRGREPTPTTWRTA